MDNIFLQISILLGITVSIAFVIRLLRQPLMIAYIISGILAGPLFLNLLHGDSHLYEAFAEFGIVLLLFMVGLSLNFDHIKRIGKAAVVTGVGQIVFTGGIGFYIVYSLGFSVVSALYLGIAMTFSSTIVIVKLLGDKKDTESVYGRHVFGLMVVQDILAVLVMIFITTISGNGSDIGATISKIIIKALALGGLVYALARYVLPKVLDKIANLSEFLFIFTIAWCFGLASLLTWLGFSIEIGAIISGLSLGSSPYQRQISSRIKPLRDFFIVLFFIILGSQMGISGLGLIVVPGIILSIFILFADPSILYLLFRRLKFTRRNSFLAGVTAAQVSEFGFILLFTGIQAGHIGGSELSVFTMVALITIFISSYAITYNEQLYRFLIPAFNIFGKDRYQQAEEKEEVYDVWVFGYHRIGWKVCEALQEKKISYAVVDFNTASISKLKHRGIPAYFGDAADVEFLSTLPLEKAKMVVSTLPEADDQMALVTHVRSKSSKTRVVLNLYHTENLEELYQAGADYVMMPHLLGGSWISRVLHDQPWTKNTFKSLRKEQKEEMKLRFTAGTH